ncbi:MAG TPA: hypothetical protein VFP94_10350 [Terriglobales bacterium]|nr:hypothetical protein [Terriglobales bacterium]
MTSWRQHGSLVSIFAWVLLVVAMALAITTSAHADTLYLDTFSISIACNGNAACGSGPYASTVVAPYTVPLGQAGFSVYDPVLSVGGSFTNYPDHVIIELTPLDPNTFAQGNFAAGGFIGLYLTATSPLGAPLQITFANTSGTTDGFSIASDVSYGLNQNGQYSALLNFAGLTGTVGADVAQLNLSVSPVPEPATWALLAGGLMTLGLWAEAGESGDPGLSE